MVSLDFMGFLHVPPAWIGFFFCGQKGFPNDFFLFGGGSVYTSFFPAQAVFKKLCKDVRSEKSQNEGSPNCRIFGLNVPRILL